MSKDEPAWEMGSRKAGASSRTPNASRPSKAQPRLLSPAQFIPPLSDNKKPVYAYVALGSNQGDSRRCLSEAARRLEALSIEPVLVSSWWQTEPVDCPPGSPPFLNAVLRLRPRPGETPESLLEKLQSLEREFGRQPKTIPNEPRPLDLDLIAFGEEIRATPELTLPHPRARLRRFVLAPLAEIAPELRWPGSTRTVAELLGELPSIQRVRKT